MIKEWQRGLGLQVVEDNVKKPNPHFLQHLREATNKSKSNNNCSLCGLWVNHKQFQTTEDHTEYKISGMCKPCMDSIFGGDK